MARHSTFIVSLFPAAPLDSACVTFVRLYLYRAICGEQEGSFEKDNPTMHKIANFFAGDVALGKGANKDTVKTIKAEVDWKRARAKLSLVTSSSGVSAGGGLVGDKQGAAGSPGGDSRNLDRPTALGKDDLETLMSELDHLCPFERA